MDFARLKMECYNLICTIARINFSHSSLGIPLTNIELILVIPLAKNVFFLKKIFHNILYLLVSFQLD